MRVVAPRRLAVARLGARLAWLTPGFQLTRRALRALAGPAAASATAASAARSFALLALSSAFSGALGASPLIGHGLAGSLFVLDLLRLSDLSLLPLALREMRPVTLAASLGVPLAASPPPSAPSLLALAFLPCDLSRPERRARDRGGSRALAMMGPVHMHHRALAIEDGAFGAALDDEL